MRNTLTSMPLPILIGNQRMMTSARRLHDGPWCRFQRGQDRGFGVGPGRRVLSPRRDRSASRAEQIAVWHNASERDQDVDAVVYEVSDCQLCAVQRLVGSPSAEPQVGWRDAGLLLHSVVDEPLLGAVLHAGPALGHQPDTAAEEPDQAGECVQRPVDRRGAQHLLDTTLEECRVVPAWMVVAIDDDPADVDTKPRRNR